MLLKTLIKIEKDVMNANSMSDLELLSDNIRLALYPNLDKQLCQVQMVDEEYRFIVYEPIKFLGSNSNEGEVAILYDLVYIRDNMFR